MNKIYYCYYFGVPSEISPFKKLGPAKKFVNNGNNLNNPTTIVLLLRISHSNYFIDSK